MREKFGKRRWLVLIFAVWAVVLGVLVGVGLSRSDEGPARRAGEDVLVSVTGTGAVASQEPEATAAVVAEEPAAEQVGESPAVTKASRTSDKPSVTKKPRVTETPQATEKTRATEKPRATEAPKKTEKPPATYTFTIECKRILDRTELWRDGLDEVIPADGVYYSGERKWKRNESVYDALTDICEENDILLDSRYTPIYETYYVSGIGNLYEFDCGSESGWKYSVNGVLPGVGCSRYTIGKGDVVVFFYDYQI